MCLAGAILSTIQALLGLWCYTQCTVCLKIMLMDIVLSSHHEQVATDSYKDLMGGRYKYLNNFMESMQVEEEDR